MDRDLRKELYLALLLLGADPVLLASVERESEGEMGADVRNWNEAKFLEMKEWLPTLPEGELEATRSRIQQYEDARRSLSLS